ncbi:hypothetical protein CWB98_10295 [Pseudoalteromonas rubra]|uniref:Uncharacterized protein n=1 Tax=Pseudoalteromonas rubra TaxID=43658 RepID=A0A5S3X0Q4_9GAMM|nr:hypothetical protein CWB98_10295 [Pseudoalteromonas rubra]
MQFKSQFYQAKGLSTAARKGGLYLSKRHQLNGTFDENLRHFKLKDAEPSLAFEVDEDNTLQYIIYGGNITVGSGSLVVGSANEKVVISPEKMTLTEADITAKKCQ